MFRKFTIEKEEIAITDTPIRREDYNLTVVLEQVTSSRRGIITTDDGRSVVQRVAVLIFRTELFHSLQITERLELHGCPLLC